MMWAKQKSSGFTLVELLIVIVIIAILAAIAIVSYNGITERAQAVKAATAVDAYIKLFNMYKLDHGVYPSSGAGGYDCLGEASHYPAADGFPAGQCDTSEDARVSDELNNRLSAYTSPLPDPSIPALDDPHSAYNVRGIMLFSFGDAVLFFYTLKGDVPCPRGNKDSSAPGYTQCTVDPAQY